MTDDRDRAVRELLDRHTPDEAEAADWARVVRASARRGSWWRPPVRRLHWLPGAVGALGLAALVGALIISTPGGRDAGSSAPTTRNLVSVALRAYLRDDAPAAQIAQLQAALDAFRQEGRVASFTFVSKEAALEELRERLKDPSILDQLPANPLPARFDIRLSPGGHAEEVVAGLTSEPALDPRLGVMQVSGAAGG